MRLGKTIATGTVLMLVSGLTAAETGFYFGGSIGQRLADIDGSADEMSFTINEILTDVFLVPPPTYQSHEHRALFDDEDIGWKGYIGWQPHEYLFVEGGYLDLGDNTVELTTRVDFVDALSITDTVSLVENTEGFFAVGGITYPVSEKFDVFAKVGAYISDTDNVLGGTVLGLPATDVIDIFNRDNDTSLMGGLGGRYQITDRFSVRAEWEYVDVVRQETHLFSLGLEFRFLD